MGNEKEPITPAARMYEQAAIPPAAEKSDAPAAVSEPAKVEFTPEQQTKITEIIKSSMGRAAAEVRAKLAQAERELELTKAQLEVQSRANAPDADETDRLRAQVAERDRKLEEANARELRKDREQAIRAAARAEGFCDDGDALRFVSVPDDADAAAISTAVRQVAEQKPHLIKSSVLSGSGSGPASRPVRVEPELRELFGPGSNARAANQLALSDPQKYKSLRREAVKKGLVS